MHLPLKQMHTSVSISTCYIQASITCWNIKTKLIILCKWTQIKIITFSEGDIRWDDTTYTSLYRTVPSSISHNSFPHHRRLTWMPYALLSCFIMLVEQSSSRMSNMCKWATYNKTDIEDSRLRSFALSNIEHNVLRQCLNKSRHVTIARKTVSSETNDTIVLSQFWTVLESQSLKASSTFLKYKIIKIDNVSGDMSKQVQIHKSTFISHIYRTIEIFNILHVNIA